MSAAKKRRIQSESAVMAKHLAIERVRIMGGAKPDTAFLDEVVRFLARGQWANSPAGELE